MKETSKKICITDSHLGCFSEFNGEDPVCGKLCALRLSCVIERNNNVRMEIFEELADYEDMNILLQ